MKALPGKLEFEPPYDLLLSGILSFGKLEEAEQTITKLEILRQRFLQSGDKKGVEYCRRVGMEGRKRAEMISRNKRVESRKRLLKKETALWFAIWLETPDLFADWLALRKETPEFKCLSVEH
jgi:hypothetical protein